MALTERLALLVTLDANGAIRGLNNVGRTAERELSKAESRSARMARGFQKAGVGMLGTSALLATGLYQAGQSAADLEQAVGGTEAVFKDTSGTIDRFAKDAAASMGLSERAFRESTTRFGGQLKGLGFGMDDAANKSIELTRTAADLAATYGGTTADAVDALAAAMRGEADPAERFNLFLNQTRVNAKAVELGLADTTSKVDANAKAQAVLALVTEQSADALGQFSRESGTAAGQMQIANAEFENAKAALGQSVAPILADVAGGLSKVTRGFASANQTSGGLLSKLATFGTIGLGAAGGLSLIVGKVIAMRENLGKLPGVARQADGSLSRMGAAIRGLGLIGAVAGLAAMANSIEDVTVNVDALEGGLAKANRAQKAQLGSQLAAIDGYGKLDEVISDAADSNVKLAEEMVALAEAAGLPADRIAELNDILDTKRAGDVKGAQDQAAYNAEIEEGAEAVGGLTSKLGEQEEALQGVLDATLAQFDANLGYRRAVDDVEDSLSDLLETQKEHGTNSEEYRDALLDTEGALLDQAAASVRLYEDTLKASGETLTAKQKTELYKAELVRLQGQLAANSPLRSALQSYIDQLTSVPATISTSLRLFGGPVAGSSGPTVRFRASGGPVSARESYVVGERGPELLTLGSQSGFVTPNDALGGESGGSTTIVLQIGDRVLDEIVVDSLDRYESKHGAVRVRTRAS